MSNKVEQLQKETVLWGKSGEKKNIRGKNWEKKRYCQWNMKIPVRETVTILMVNTIEKQSSPYAYD